MGNTRQQQILSQMGIPQWHEREPSVTEAYTINTEQIPLHSVNQQDFGIKLSGNSDSAFLWLTESTDLTVADESLLLKIKAAVAGGGDCLIANLEAGSSISFNATIKDQLITRVIVFGSTEFHARVTKTVKALSVDLICAPELAQLAGSSELKRKLWEQLKTVSVD